MWQCGAKAEADVPQLSPGITFYLTLPFQKPASSNGAITMMPIIIII
jgi:hypothetical protein